MTVINHALTGALVAVAINRPWLSLPAALASHFVVDAIPHWDYFDKNFTAKRVALMTDITLTLGLLLILAVTVDASRRLLLAGGILGVTPDLMWAPYLITGNRSMTDKKNPLHLARRFHFWIQIKEFAQGIYVEAAWLILMLVLIYHIHK